MDTAERWVQWRWGVVTPSFLQWRKEDAPSNNSESTGVAVNDELKCLRALSVVMGALLLAGCATNTTPESPRPERRVLDAKARAQQFELRVAELIPRDAVDTIDQRPEGSLQSCGDGDMWAGGLTIALRADVRPTAVLTELGQKAEAEGLRVTRSRSFNGTERITVSEGDGVSVLLDTATNSIEGGSFSSCFSLPEGFYRGGDF